MGVPIFLLALVGAAAAIVMRRRIRDYVSGPALDDDMIRRIEQDGAIEIDEPLDLDEVRAEEERFWSESWDIPDED